MSEIPPRTERSPRVVQIVVAARELLVDEGVEALTMRRLGDRIGIRAPSLYKHFSSKTALVAALIDDGFTEMGTALHRSLARPGRQGPVAALLGAYRATALATPNLYRLTSGPEIPRELLTPGLEAWSGEPFFSVTGDPHVAQALWGCAHGLSILEIEQRFMDDSDLDRTWQCAAQAFTGTSDEHANR